MIDFDGERRTCREHPGVELADEPAAVRHLHEAHPGLWAQATRIDATLIDPASSPAGVELRPNRAERRAAARRRPHR